MPDITVEQVRELRDATGAGVMDCKRALQGASGSFDGALEILRKQGVASAAKRAGRTADQGVVESYIHSGSRIGALVELNCETDFVARTDGFRALAHDLAMQVAAMNPTNLSTEDADGSDVSVLLEQSFIKDPSKTVQDLVTETIATTGENIQVRRFIRFALGE
jgi:elongation factor Ts